MNLWQLGTQARTHLLCYGNFPLKRASLTANDRSQTFCSDVIDDWPRRPVALVVPRTHLEEVLGVWREVVDGGGHDVSDDGLDVPVALLGLLVGRVLQADEKNLPIWTLLDPFCTS